MSVLNLQCSFLILAALVVEEKSTSSVINGSGDGVKSKDVIVRY